MDNVNGFVEAVGTQFNGSLKVDGKWYNFKKGVKNEAKVGDAVTLTLGEWEFKGKKGVNITKAGVVANAPKEEVKTEAPKAVSPAPKTQAKEEVKTDWAAKDRSMMLGGMRHDAAELAKVAIQTATPLVKVLATFEEAYKGIIALAKEIQ